MEELILKYEKARQSQIDLKQQTPLTNAVQHQLLDQNIHLFDGILNDLLSLAIRSSVPQANKLFPHVSNNEVKLKALLERLLEENMCSVVGDELIEEALKSL